MRKSLFTFSLCCIFFMASFQLASAQDKSQQKETKMEKKEQREAKRKLHQAQRGIKNISRIESLNFSFYPNTVEPEFGMQRDLDGLYYFTVDKNIIDMDLPYIGRFYVTPVDPENIAINLTSSKFVYFVHTDDEVTFHVSIFPSDQVSILNQDIKFYFTLNKTTGAATLEVSAENRQNITYTGTFN